MKIYEYLRESGIRSFIFLVGHRFESFETVKGRKRVNLKRLFIRTTLRERDQEDVYQKPDKELLVDMIIPPDNVSSKKKRI